MYKVLVLLSLLHSFFYLWDGVTGETFVEIFDAAHGEDEEKSRNTSTTQLPNTLAAAAAENVNAVVVAPAPTQEQPGQAARGLAESSQYHLHTEALTWMDAEIACWRRGGLLAAPRSHSEAVALGHLLMQNAANITRTDMRDAMHVGVQDISRLGLWRTLDGLLLSEAGYDLWLDGGSGCCGALIADGRYVRQACGVELAYVCRKRTALTLANMPDYIEIPGAGHFRLHEEPLPWPLARQRCEEEGASLAVPASAREAGLLAGVLMTHTKQALVRKEGFFVGITDIAKEGDWRTMKGESLVDAGYDAWAPHQPSGRRSENCGKLTADGRYADNACMMPLPFCCKRVSLVEWRADVLTDGAFRLHLAERTWFEALLACQRENASLAVPSAADVPLLVALMQMAREARGGMGGRVHVGIHDMGESGTWRTLWGEVVMSDDPALSFFGFGRFSIKKIKLHGRVSENCGSMNNVGEYANLHCSVKLPYICQKLPF